MKILKNLILVSSVLVSLAIPGAAFAIDAPCGDNCNTGAGPSGNTTSTTTETSPISNPNCNDPSEAGLQNCLKHNKIITDLNNIIDFLSAGVGIVVVGALIVGSIQYIMAGDSPEASGKAKERITNALIALVAFIFIFSFLQWIIPGGL